MKVKYIIGAIVETVIKVVALIFIVTYVTRGATAAYDYGFRVFAMEAGEGRIISVSVASGDTAKEVGQMLQDKGLIRDAGLFRIQELLSENHGNIQPGIYDLSTSMTAQEMLAVIAVKPETEEEEE